MNASSYKSTGSVAPDILMNDQLAEPAQKGMSLHCQKTKPASNRAYDLAGEAYEMFRNKLFMPDEAKELLYILSQPNIRALFDVHDRVATKEYIPVLPDVLPQFDDDDISVKCIQLIKNNEPLGLTIKKREGEGMIYVARVMVGGPADRSGLIEVGDEIHEVNGIPVKNRPIEQVVQILNTTDGTISLKLIPVPLNHEHIPSTVKMRANFSYNPTTDLLIPCRDVGLQFKCGDILRIVNTDDPIWWQAKRYYDKSGSTGLIPSRTLQTRRMNEFCMASSGRLPSSPSVTRKISSNQNYNTSTLAGGLVSPRLQRKISKSKLKPNQQAVIREERYGDFDYQAPVYEEVELYKPPQERPRPIVIIGVPGVGQHDLQFKLVKENSHLKQPIPVTSRPKKLLESDGKEFKFISKSEMDKLVNNNMLVEHGEYKGHLYGISIHSVLDMVKEGKTPVLLCQPKSLEHIRTSTLKPYIIMMKPPNMDTLKQIKTYTGEKTTTKLTMPVIEEMILGSAHIESHYSTLIDETIINTEFNTTYKQLLTSIRRAQNEENWVPSEWIHKIQ